MTSQVWQEEVEGNGEREHVLIQAGITPELPEELPSFLPAAGLSFWWFRH